MAITVALRRIRESHGMNQRQVAHELGVTHGAVAKWELGYTSISMENLLALADLFHCTTDALLGREPVGSGDAAS